MFQLSPRDLAAVIVGPIIGILLEFLFLKLALKITKSEKRTNFKWVIGSFFIQAGVIGLGVAPFILTGLTFGFRGPPDFGLIIPFIIIIPIVLINVINVLHEVGIGKSILIFIFFIIPIAIAIGIVFAILRA